jgi:hypothetical protein
MEIDLGKVVIIILAVLPGFLARRGNARVIPRAQRKMGATEEIAEFFIYSIAAHLCLAVFSALLFAFAGLLLKHSLLFYLDGWRLLSPLALLQKVESLPAGILAFYLVLALLVGWLIGVARGLLDAWRVAELAFGLVGPIFRHVGRFWSQNIERFLITERPIIYGALFPELDENGEPKTVYLELLLRDNQGYLSGRVASFSICNDEENHKLVFLKDTYFKATKAAAYESLDGDGVLIDLADALTVQIKQV